MSFFMIGGFVSIATSVVLIIIYLIAHKEDDNSLAAKIVIWTGMLFGVAGASLLTIEYSFPQISHPKKPYVPTVYDHFVSYYGESYDTFIKEHRTHTEINEYISVKHNQLKTRDDIETPDSGYKYTFFKTDVVYEADYNFYTISILNEYIYTEDYSYQNIISQEII